MTVWDVVSEIKLKQYYSVLWNIEDKIKNVNENRDNYTRHSCMQLKNKLGWLYGNYNNDNQ